MDFCVDRWGQRGSGKAISEVFGKYAIGADASMAKERTVLNNPPKYARRRSERGFRNASITSRFHEKAKRALQSIKRVKNWVNESAVRA